MRTYYRVATLGLGTSSPFLKQRLEYSLPDIMMVEHTPRKAYPTY